MHCLVQCAKLWDARRFPPEPGEPSKAKAKGGSSNESLAPLALEDFSLGQELQRLAPGFDDVLLKMTPCREGQEEVRMKSSFFQMFKPLFSNQMYVSSQINEIHYLIQAKELWIIIPLLLNLQELG